MTNISSPPLQLKYYFVEELHIKAMVDRTNVENDDGAARILQVKEEDVESSFEHAQTSGDSFKHRITLSVSTKPNIALPWEIKLKIQGFFDLSPEFSAKPNAKDLLCVNGGSLLYTVAREVIFSGTSRGPFGSVFLPTVRFAPANLPPDSGPKAKPNKVPSVATT